MNAEQGSQQKKLSRSVTKLIINWLNNFNREPKIKTLTELSDGRILLYLVEIIVKDKSCFDNEMFLELEVDEEMNKRFKLVEHIINC
jgi:hypothetical protein